MKNKTKKDKWFKRYFSEVNKTSFWTCLIISIALIVGAFFVPPMSVIDASVIAATGELFAFAALGTVITGIEKGKNISVSKGDTIVSLQDNNDNNENEITE